MSVVEREVDIDQQHAYHKQVIIAEITNIGGIGDMGKDEKNWQREIIVISLLISQKLSMAKFTSVWWL